MGRRILVVICFKFSNFAYANTVASSVGINQFELLFALNLVTLLMQIQCGSGHIRFDASCYLL